MNRLACALPRLWSRRFFSTPSGNVEYCAERLKERSVLSIKGADAESFLQELTTNDIRILDVRSSMFTLFLNGNGRVIHDAIIYKRDKGEYLVECDIEYIQALEVHMFMFNARKKVSVQNIEHELSTWTVFNPKDTEKFIEECNEDDCPSDMSRREDMLEDLDLGEDVIISNDPRMWPLGTRILAPRDLNIIKSIKDLGLKIKTTPNLYKTLRYKLGIGEGTSEVGYGRCLPAEVNGDYLQGIDMNKTNYVGFVPEVKKKNVETRLMPIKVKVQYGDIPVNTPIEDGRGKKIGPVGYLRGLQGSLGLGHMNISDGLRNGNVRIGKTLMQVLRPPWWK